MKKTTTHILLVEDEAAHVELICRAFESEAGWASLIIVSTLRDAREYLTASTTDLMIVDLLLPDGNGIELLPGDREEATFPIVVMTSHGDEQIAVEAMKTGALDYVIKSETTLAAMPRTVKRVLREWGYLIERKQIKAALRASEEKYHALFTSMLSGFAYHKIITDKQGHPKDYVFLEVNDAFERLTGLKKENIVGEKLTEAIPEIKDEAFYWIERYGKVALTGQEIKFEQYSEALNRWYSIAAYSPRKGYFAVVFDDITERRQLEVQLRQSQRMEAVGLMAGGIAHNFNNIMTGIMGYVELAQAQLSPSHPVASDMQKVLKAAQRAANLTKQLLAFTRHQVLEPEVINLNDLLLETNTMLSQLISEAIELEMQPEPELWRVVVDHSQIEQVLVNLVLNACSAMPEGGKLTIKTANIALDQAYIDQYAPEIIAGHYVMLAVTDTGIGMGEEVKTHIFEPFFTTKEVGQGTGLGLSTCYGIVKQSDGHISVESAPEEGATLRVYLPRYEEAPGRQATETLIIHNLPRRTETILLVEDEALVRDVTARVLRQQGYTVLEAENGEDALQMVDELTENQFDLLVSDMVMPRMAGDILAERLKSVHPTLKVLLISGYTDDMNNYQGILKSDIPFLSKPFTWTELVLKVQEVLDTPTPPGG